MVYELYLNKKYLIKQLYFNTNITIFVDLSLCLDVVCKILAKMAYR